MELIIGLQRDNGLKRVFETSKSKTDFYCTNIAREKFPDSRSPAQNVVSAFGSTHARESFFSKMEFAKDESRSTKTDG